MKRFRRFLSLAGIALGAAAVCGLAGIEVSYRISRHTGNETLHGATAQARALLYGGTDNEIEYHSSLRPRLIPIGTYSEHALPNPFTAVAFNMAALHYDGNIDEALDTLFRIREEHDPDLFLLTEFPGDTSYRKHRALEGLGGVFAWDFLKGADLTLPYNAQPPSFRYSGNALLSKSPIEDLRVLTLPKVEDECWPDVVLLRNAILGKIGSLDVVLSHFGAHVPPEGREKQAAALAPYVTSTTLLGGDLNFCLRNVGDGVEPGYELLTDAGLVDTLSVRDRFAHLSPLNPKDRMYAFTDHILVSGRDSLDAMLFPAPGSDHNLIVARIEY